MKKIFIGGFLSLISLFLFVDNVNAASANVSITSSSNKIVIGNTFKITVKVSSSVALGSWEYTLKYDSSKVSLVSSDVPLHYASYGDGKTKSKSYSYTFKAVKSGSASFSLSGTAVADWDTTSYMSVTNGSRTVTLITQAELEASYSNNNDLKSLSIDGYEITPVFSKDVITYTTNLPSTETKINIKANKDDNTANVKGIGEFEVSEGLNTFEVVVTAQNGNVKTYTINVNVEDTNPIEVKIDKNKYVVVKRKDLVECPGTYTESELNINDFLIPVCRSEISDYILVGLKDESGNIALYIYEAEKNNYSKYLEFSLNNIIFSPIATSKKIAGYSLEKIKINDILVDAFVYEDSDFKVLYGKNIETGVIGFYSYDSKDNTIQRYNVDEINDLKKDIKDYLLIIIIFGGGLFVAIILLIIVLSQKKKIKKIENKVELVEEEKKMEKSE